MNAKTGSRLSGLDWSTINLDELNKLPLVKLAPTYRLDSDCGNGCLGDPPGFPTYFTRSVYTSHGNSPQRGPVLLIAMHAVENAEWNPNDKTWDQHKARQDALFLRLWKPLPLEHPRTQAWIRSTFKHHRHCYQVPALRAEGKNWHDSTLIWPGGCLGNTPFGRVRDIDFEIKCARENRCYDKWTEEHKTEFQTALRLENERITKYCEAVAIPDNHCGTIIVRRYYSEFVPTPELIAGEFESEGNWWETLSNRPAPEACPGQYGHAHPVNGTWCQFCGWHNE